MASSTEVTAQVPPTRADPAPLQRPAARAEDRTQRERAIAAAIRSKRALTRALRGA